MHEVPGGERRNGVNRKMPNQSVGGVLASLGPSRTSGVTPEPLRCCGFVEQPVAGILCSGQPSSVSPFGTWRFFQAVGIDFLSAFIKTFADAHHHRYASLLRSGLIDPAFAVGRPESPGRCGGVIDALQQMMDAPGIGIMARAIAWRADVCRTRYSIGSVEEQNELLRCVQRRRRPG